MTWEADLKAHLQADASISGLVQDKIYPLLRKEGTGTPAITYQRITGMPQTDLDGLDGKMLDVRAQIDVWAQGFDTARTLAEYIRLRLQTAASTFRARVNFDQDFYEPDTRLYRVSLDASFWYRTS